MYLADGINAFGNMTEPVEYLGQIMLLHQQQANLAVARQVAGTGQNQVARAG